MNSLLAKTELYPLTNKAGTGVAYGDVVILSSTYPAAFALNAASGYSSGLIGVVADPNGIINNSVGEIAIGGFAPQINLDTYATVNQIIKASGSQKLGTPHSAPFASGDFAVVLGSGTTPPAWLLGSTAASSVTASSSTPVDIASAGVVGVVSEYARGDHAHKGIHSISVTGSSQLFGDVLLMGATGTTLTQSGNNIIFAGAGGAGGGSSALDILQIQVFI